MPAIPIASATAVIPHNYTAVATNGDNLFLGGEKKLKRHPADASPAALRAGYPGAKPVNPLASRAETD